MDPRKLIEDLKSAHEHIAVFKEKEKEIIEKESEVLITLTDKLKSFATTKFIHGEEALLIYVFPSKDKTLISPEVYLKSDGRIAYQVYNEVGYRGYRPDAYIVDGFVTINLEEFLQFISLLDIYDFFVERIEVLYEDAEKIHSKNDERLDFIHKLKTIL